MGCLAIATPSVEEALDEAALLAEGEAVVLVTGSIFVAAAARSVWLARSSEKNLLYTGN
jgi:folylpolyglutamate synthase/dihydropteroate synthase